MFNTIQVKNQLTEEQIVKILLELGSSQPKKDKDGNLIFQTICHGGNSHKLYYYKNNKSFYCYSECLEQFDIFSLVCKVKKITFKQSFKYICDFFNIKVTEINSIPQNTCLRDWEIIDKYSHLINEVPNKIDECFYNPNILNYFSDLYCTGWIKENISIEVMKKFQIKFDVLNNRIIIPHFNKDGKLLGIRCRNLNEEEVLNGNKYMPIKIDNTLFSHSLSNNLYGFYENKESIRRLKKVMIVEGEKSVLKVESMFPNNNFCVACCGSNISNQQRNLLLELGVNEVLIAMDKEKNKNNSIAKCSNQMLQLCSKFAPYVRTCIIEDNKNLLDFKDAPVDKGKATLLELMKNKVEFRIISE